jgi:hypothetical protein
VLTVLFLIAYYLVETIDAAEYDGEVNIPVVCFPQATKKKRYCAQCAKTVIGLDHHCSWLNTCIGIQNYVPFISLVTIGFLQMALQVCFGMLTLLLLLLLLLLHYYYHYCYHYHYYNNNYHYHYNLHRHTSSSIQSNYANY